MNDYLCILRPSREGFVDAPTDDEVAAVRAHFAYLQHLTAAGICRLAGRTDGMGMDTIGIVLYRAATLSDATELAHNDPAVVNGVMTATIHDFRLGLLADRVIE